MIKERKNLIDKESIYRSMDIIERKGNSTNEDNKDLFKLFELSRCLYHYLIVFVLLV
jgi:hypothetical protein